MPLRAREGIYTVVPPPGPDNQGAEAVGKETKQPASSGGISNVMWYKLRIFLNLYRSSGQVEVDFPLQPLLDVDMGDPVP